MSDPTQEHTQDQLSVDQREALANAAFIVRVLQLREEGKREERKSWLRGVLDSAGAAALVTAIVAVFVQLIAFSFQQAAKEREFQLAWMKEIVRNGYDLVSRSVGASEDVMLLATTNFQPKGSKDVAIQKQQTEILNQFNLTDKDWRRQRETVALLLGSYYRADPEAVTKAWENEVGAVNGFMDCARRFYADNQQKPLPQVGDACMEKKRVVEEKRKLLSEEVNKSHASLSGWWQVWKH